MLEGDQFETIPVGPVRMYVDATKSAASDNLISSLRDLIEDAQACLRTAEEGGVPTSIGVLSGHLAEVNRQTGILDTIAAVERLVAPAEKK